MCICVDQIKPVHEISRLRLELRYMYKVNVTGTRIRTTIKVAWSTHQFSCLELMDATMVLRLCQTENIVSVWDSHLGDLLTNRIQPQLLAHLTNSIISYLNSLY